MSDNDVRKQISASAALVKSWPDWKQNILAHSSQPMNSNARPPVANQNNGSNSQSEQKH